MQILQSKKRKSAQKICHKFIEMTSLLLMNFYFKISEVQSILKKG